MFFSKNKVLGILDLNRWSLQVCNARHKICIVPNFVCTDFFCAGVVHWPVEWGIGCYLVLVLEYTTSISQVLDYYSDVNGLGSYMWEISFPQPSSAEISAFYRILCA
ncbi:hypothetical protein CFOL_v3_14400 [Cephalotus follicularis]|uniref:Uncharacterized protein n=1 Tax=Cephalotus follicularis TaxID=3775 RepID=A0A1Q3BSM7_CEPFO|nr:hypothetical protein CFOL_v3_14400 [Cephalotus follicularis]